MLKNLKRYIVKAAVVLLIVVRGVIPSSIRIINPWLAGCDLANPFLPDLQGTCTSSNPALDRKKQEDAGVVTCPEPCPQTGALPAVPKCLHYLNDFTRNVICNFSPTTRREWLINLLGEIRLRHCCEHKVGQSLAHPLLQKVLRGSDECFAVIDDLIKVDDLAGRVSCEFNEVLARFDCDRAYSVRSNCEDCKESYRRWACASMIPFFNGSLRIRPCRSVCHAVENHCPYFLPENRSPTQLTQYAGEPIFLCSDPSIPESADQMLRSIHPPDGTCCVKHCGLPRDGLCIQKGVGCDGKPGHDISYTSNCDNYDWNLGRVPPDRCSGPPLNLNSRAPPRTGTSYPVIALSTFVTLQVTQPQRRVLILFPVILFLRSSSFGVLQSMAFFNVTPFTPITNIFGGNGSNQFIRISQSVLYSFTSLFHRGQYYTIKVSVQLKPGEVLVSEPLSPLRPPILGRHNRFGRRYFRRHLKRYTVLILSMGTQRLVDRDMYGAAEEGGNIPYNCVITGTPANGELGIGMEFQASSIRDINPFGPIIPSTIYRFSTSRKGREMRKNLMKRLMKENHIRCDLNNGSTVIFIKNSFIGMNLVYKTVLTILFGWAWYKYECYVLKKRKIARRNRQKKKANSQKLPISGKATKARKRLPPTSANPKN